MTTNSLTQGIFQFLMFTYLHNELVIGLSLAAVAALGSLISRPRRPTVFFFVGFLLLILHFEYQKHIVEGFAEQSIATLFLEEGHYRGRWLTQVVIYYLIPGLMWLLGWGSIVIGVVEPPLKFLDHGNKKKPERPHEKNS